MTGIQVLSALMDVVERLIEGDTAGARLRFDALEAAIAASESGQVDG